MVTNKQQSPQQQLFNKKEQNQYEIQSYRYLKNCN